MPSFLCFPFEFNLLLFLFFHADSRPTPFLSNVINFKYSFQFRLSTHSNTCQQNSSFIIRNNEILKSKSEVKINIFNAFDSLHSSPIATSTISRSVKHYLDHHLNAGHMGAKNRNLVMVVLFYWFESEHFVHSGCVRCDIRFVIIVLC